MLKSILHPKTILFDLDGTLLDRERSLKNFVAKQYKRFQPVFGNISEKAYSESFIELDAYGMVWKDKVYQDLLAGFTITNISWQELLEDYINNFSTDCLLYTGVKPTLEKLKNNGYLIVYSPIDERLIQLLIEGKISKREYLDLCLIDARNITHHRLITRFYPCNNFILYRRFIQICNIQA